MMSLARRSISEQPWAPVVFPVIIVLMIMSGVASAQRTVTPPVMVRPPVAPVPISPSPIYRPPAIQPPMARPPVNTLPIYITPRSGIVASPGRVSTSIVLPPIRPIHPIRPRPPAIFVYSPYYIFGDPFWRSNSCWWGSWSCDQFWLWPLNYTSVYSPGPVSYAPQPVERQVYVESEIGRDFPQDFPRLFLKDGTILTVRDYWVVDGQLHFKMVEAVGQKPVEQSIPFEDLDLQRTVDANSARGFQFILRNEPFEDYVAHHPEGAPPALQPSHD